ncbi:MAG: hypothetical protein ABUK01_03450 [Leptospirales bacterium]
MKLSKRLVYIIMLLLCSQTMWAADDVEDSSYMKVRIRIQTRMVAGEVATPYASVRDYDALDFNFRRLRAGFIFQGADWFGGIVDLRLENFLAKPTLSSTNTLTDAYSAIEFANFWLATGLPESRITFGQFKLPFFREGLASSGNFVALERSFMNSMIQLYDIGVMFDVNPLGFVGSMKNKMKFMVSLTNGDGAGDDGVGRKYVQASNSGEPTAPLWNARLEYHPLGGPEGKAWKEGTEVFDNNNLLSFGVSGMYTESAEYGRFANNLSVGGVSGDMTLFLYQIYLNASVTKFTGNAANDNFSYQATAGYVLPVGKRFLMAVFRYDYFELDLDGNQNIENSEILRDFWIGFNFYLQKSRIKGQVFYQIRRDHLTINGGDVRDNAVYFQMQTDFGKKIK